MSDYSDGYAAGMKLGKRRSPADFVHLGTEWCTGFMYGQREHERMVTCAEKLRFLDDMERRRLRK